MSRYIDADALLKDINQNTAEAHNERCAQILEAILHAQTADVVEVRHGYNNFFDTPSLFECSVCGAYDGDTYTGEGEYNYCPWCGAKMDGERSAEE